VKHIGFAPVFYFHEINSLLGRGVFTVMPAQEGIQLFPQDISGFPPARA
jgi:hypothetical protein